MLKLNVNKLLLLSMILMAVVAYNCAGFSVKKAGCYRASCDSIRVSAAPNRIEITERMVKLHYPWGVMPYRIVRSSTNGRRVDEALADSVSVSTYTVVSPVTGTPVRMAYLTSFVQRKAVRRELVIEQDEQLLTFTK